MKCARVMLLLLGVGLVGCGNADLARDLAARGDRIIQAQEENTNLALDRLTLAQGNARNAEMRSLLRGIRAAVEAKEKLVLPAVPKPTPPGPMVPPIPTGSPETPTTKPAEPPSAADLADILTGGKSPPTFDPWAKLESELLLHWSRRQEDQAKIGAARRVCASNATELRKVHILMVRSAEAFGDKEEVKAEIDQLRSMIIELTKAIAARKEGGP